VQHAAQELDEFVGAGWGRPGMAAHGGFVEQDFARYVGVGFAHGVLLLLLHFHFFRFKGKGLEAEV